MSTPIPGRLGRLHERILTPASNSGPRCTPSFRSVLALGPVNLKVHGVMCPSLNHDESCGRISLRLSRRAGKAIFSCTSVWLFRHHAVSHFSIASVPRRVTHSLSGHPKTGQWWSWQNRPTGKAGDSVVLSCRLLWWQVYFRTPTPRTTFEYMTMMEKTIEHGGNGGAISQ